MLARLPFSLLLVGVAALCGCRSAVPEAETPPETINELIRPEFPVIQVPFDAEGHAAAPRWSPKGQYLSYEVIGRADQRRLFVQAIGEDGPSQPVIEAVVQGTDGLLSAHGGEWHREPLVVFEAGERGQDSAIYRMIPGSKPISARLFKAESAPLPQAQPSVSPRSKQVAWVHDGDVYVWPRGQEAPRRITQTDAREWNPRFSQNGRVLLYTRGGAGTRDLYEFDLLKGVESVVADGPGDQFAGVWGNGGQVAYLSSDSLGPPYALMLVQTDRKSRRVLSTEVQMTVGGRPGVSEESDWLGFSDSGSGVIRFVHLVDQREVVLPVGLEEVGDVQIAQGFGDIYVAFTAISSDKKQRWRDLYVTRVNELLASVHPESLVVEEIKP